MNQLGKQLKQKKYLNIINKRFQFGTILLTENKCQIGTGSKLTQLFIYIINVNHPSNHSIYIIIFYLLEYNLELHLDVDIHYIQFISSNVSTRYIGFISNSSKSLYLLSSTSQVKTNSNPIRHPNRESYLHLLYYQPISFYLVSILLYHYQQIQNQYFFSMYDNHYIMFYYLVNSIMFLACIPSCYFIFFIQYNNWIFIFQYITSMYF